MYYMWFISLWWSNWDTGSEYLVDSFRFRFVPQLDLLTRKSNLRGKLGTIFEWVKRINNIIEILSALVILIGWSSGTHVASLYLEDTHVAASICFESFSSIQTKQTKRLDINFGVDHKDNINHSRCLGLVRWFACVSAL